MNKTISRAVFLDFDGVLFDTLREAYAVSMIANNRLATITEIDFGSEHFLNFDQLRYLVGPAWNYYYVMKAIDNKPFNKNNNLVAKYKSLMNQSKLEEYRNFEQKFFEVRQKLREKEHEGWLSIIFPYKIVECLLPIINEHKENFFLVTTRDRESVGDLLNLHSVDILDSNIYTKTEYESHKSKRNLIQSLITRYSIKEGLFIDDLEEHLLACATIEALSTIQAKWGYVDPSKKEDNSTFLLKKLENFIYGKNVRA